MPESRGYGYPASHRKESQESWGLGLIPSLGKSGEALNFKQAEFELDILSWL